MATEEPEFTVLFQEGNIEIREYEPRIIAHVKTIGDFDDASSKGFKMLADFIFGNNTINNASKKISMTAPVSASLSSKKISMTAPVIAENNNNEWSIAFVMPKEFTIETLPVPNNQNIRSVFKGGDDMINDAGQTNTKRLRQDNAYHHLPITKPYGFGCLILPARNCLQATTDNLCLVTREEDRHPSHNPDHDIELKPLRQEQRKDVNRNKQDGDQRHAPHTFNGRNTHCFDTRQMRTPS